MQREEDVRVRSRVHGEAVLRHDVQEQLLEHGQRDARVLRAVGLCPRAAVLLPHGVLGRVLPANVVPGR